MGFLLSFVLLVMAHLSTTVLSRENPCIFSDKSYRSDINCRDGHLTHIPYAFIGNYPAKTINLGKNYIHSLAEHEFSDLNKQTVTKILVDNNRITDLPENLFSGLFKIRQLDLSSNDFKSIGRQFCNLTSLEELFLTNNTLDEIASDAFDCLPNLHTVYLENCHINKLPVDLFKHSSLKYVSLLGNNITNMEQVHIPKGLVVDVESFIAKYPSNKEEEGAEVKEAENSTTIIIVVSFIVCFTVLVIFVAIIVIIRRRNINNKNTDSCDV